jgi:hypothetical protein
MKIHFIEKNSSLDRKSSNLPIAKQGGKMAENSTRRVNNTYHCKLFIVTNETNVYNSIH